LSRSFWDPSGWGCVREVVMTETHKAQEGASGGSEMLTLAVKPQWVHAS
jgi:hypothetical protein